MMHTDPICACIHAYNLRILNKLHIVFGCNEKIEEEEDDNKDIKKEK